MGKFLRRATTACLIAGAVYSYLHPEEAKTLAKAAYEEGKEFLERVSERIQDYAEYATHPEKCDASKGTEEDFQKIMDEFNGYE